MATVVLANRHWVKNGSSVGTMSGIATKFTGTVECGARTGSNLDTVKFTFNYNFVPREYPGDGWTASSYYAGAGWTVSFYVAGTKVGSKSTTDLGGGFSGSQSFTHKFADSASSAAVKFVLTGYNWNETLSGTLSFGAKAPSITYTDVGKPGKPDVSQNNPVVNTLTYTWTAAKAGTNNKVKRYVIDIYEKDPGDGWPSSPWISHDNGTSLSYSCNISNRRDGKQYSAIVKAYGASYNTSKAISSDRSEVSRKNIIPKTPSLSIGNGANVSAGGSITLTTNGDEYGQKTSGKVTGTLKIGSVSFSDSIAANNGKIVASGANLAKLAHPSNKYTITGIVSDGYESSNINTKTEITIGKNLSVNLPWSNNVNIGSGTTLTIPAAKIDGQSCYNGSIIYEIYGSLSSSGPWTKKIATITKTNSAGAITEKPSLDKFYKNFMTKVEANGGVVTTGYVKVKASFKGFEAESDTIEVQFSHITVSNNDITLSQIDNSNKKFYGTSGVAGTTDNPYFFRSSITYEIKKENNSFINGAGATRVDFYCGNTFIKSSAALDDKDSVLVTINSKELTDKNISLSNNITFTAKIIQTVDDVNYSVNEIPLGTYFLFKDTPTEKITVNDITAFYIGNSKIVELAKNKNVGGNLIIDIPGNSRLRISKIVLELTEGVNKRTLSLAEGTLENYNNSFTLYAGDITLDSETNSYYFPVDFNQNFPTETAIRLERNLLWTPKIVITYSYYCYTDGNILERYIDDATVSKAAMITINNEVVEQQITTSYEITSGTGLISLV